MNCVGLKFYEAWILFRNIDMLYGGRDGVGLGPLSQAWSSQTLHTRWQYTTEATRENTITCTSYISYQIV